jgi:hypothetical protein
MELSKSGLGLMEYNYYDRGDHQDQGGQSRASEGEGPQRALLNIARNNHKWLVGLRE